MTVPVNNSHPMEATAIELMDIELPQAPPATGSEWELGVWLFAVFVLLGLGFISWRYQSWTKTEHLPTALNKLLGANGFCLVKRIIWRWHLQRLATRFMKSEQAESLQSTLSNLYVWVRQIEQACQASCSQSTFCFKEDIQYLKTQCEQALFSKTEVSRETLQSILELAQKLLQRSQ